MFTHLLVPLDGTAQAESAAHLAGGWVARTGGTVTLLHVLERRPPSRVHGEPHLQSEEDATAYLTHAANRFIPPGVKVLQRVQPNRSGDVAAEIARTMDEAGCDLLVMAPHGGSGMRRLFQGTMPERVVRILLEPVLIVRGSVGGAGRDLFGSIIVPDDADDRHEEGWGTCMEVVQTFGGHVSLVAVAESHTRAVGESARIFQPAAARDIARLRKAQLSEHLNEHLSELRSRGVEAHEEVLEGDPPQMVAEFALESRAGLVILRTHSQLGLAPRLAGGFTAQFLASTQVSVLLLPIAGP